MRFCTLCRRSVPPGATICSFDGHPLTGEIVIEPTSGITVAGYRILDAIAHGESGTVYRAEDGTSGSRVALKLLSQELCSTAAVMHRVRRENKNAIKLANPNVARVLDCGDHDGRFFVVREWLEGHPLSVVLKEEGRLAVDRAGAIAFQICAALGLIHRVGLVHRDLKPNHVFVSNNEQTGEWLVKLIDIGIAAKVTGVETTRDIYGTPTYLSPEQAEGKLVSFRSDLYSLGCILFEMLTGNPVFEGTAQQLKDQHQTTTVPNIATFRDDAPPHLAQLVTKLLAKQASARPFSAAMVQRELERVVPNCKLPLAPVMTGRGGVVASAPPPSVSPQPQAGEGLGMADTLFSGSITADAVQAAAAAPAPDGQSTVRGMGPAQPPTPAPQAPVASPFPGFVPAPGAQQGDGGAKRTMLGLPVITPAQIEARRVGEATPDAPPARSPQPAPFQAPVSGAVGMAATGAEQPGASPAATPSPALPFPAQSPGPVASPSPQTGGQQMASTVLVDPSMGATEVSTGAAQQQVHTSPAPVGPGAMQPMQPQASAPTTDELRAEFKGSSNKLIMYIIITIVVVAIVSALIGLSFCFIGNHPGLDDASHVPSAMLMESDATVMPRLIEPGGDTVPRT